MKMGSRLSVLFIAVTMVGVLLLTSCNGQSAPAPATNATSTPVPAAATPTPSKPTGKLTLATNLYTARVLGPANEGLETGNTFQAWMVNVFDQLTELAPDGKTVRPGIAEKWEIAKDGLSQTFTIRKGVKFHNGDTLTAADVKFSFDVLFKTSTHTDWTKVANRAEIKDDSTVVLNLNQPMYDLLYGMSGNQGTMAVLPKKYIEEKGWDYFGKNPIGSGPYRVVTWEAGNRMDLEALDSHWRVAPKVKNITFINVKEEGTKVAMLKTGELDVAEVSADSVASLKAAGLKVAGHYGSAQWYVSPIWDFDNPKAHAFGNLSVRKGLSLAINRQELATTLAGGYGKPAAGYAIPESSWFFDPNTMKADPFDLEGAKKLFADAGYPSGFNTKIWDTAGGGVMSNVFAAVAGYWRKAGVNATIEAADYTLTLRKVTPTRDPSMYGSVWGTMSGGDAGAFDALGRRYNWPTGVVRNPDARLNELFKLVPGTADTAQRTKLAQEATKLAIDGYTAWPLVNVDTIYAVGAKVGQFQLTQGVTGWGAALDTITLAK